MKTFRSLSLSSHSGLIRNNNNNNCNRNNNNNRRGIVSHPHPHQYKKKYLSSRHRYHNINNNINTNTNRYTPTHPHYHNSSLSLSSLSLSLSSQSLSLSQSHTKRELTIMKSSTTEQTALLNNDKDNNDKEEVKENGKGEEEEYTFGPLLGVKTLNQVINLHKVTTLFVFITAMIVSGNFSLPAMMYTALHGCYGMCWCMRYIVTPDKSFETPMSSIIEFTTGFLVLGLMYWTGGLLMIMTQGTNTINNFQFGLPTTLVPPVDVSHYHYHYDIQLAVAVFVFGIGLYLTYVSDTQKYFTLKYKKPKGLITEGLFSRSRNINYLGEMGIYTAFALVANNAYTVVAVVLMWITLFRSNMIKKDKSLSRYKAFEEYKQRSNILLPKLFVKKK